MKRRKRKEQEKKNKRDTYYIAVLEGLICAESSGVVKSGGSVVARQLLQISDDG